MPPGEYDGYVTSKQKLCTLDAKSTYCNFMTEMRTAGIWDPILDNYPTFLLVTLPNIHRFIKKSLTDSNTPLLFWLLTIPPHLKYVATLPCNLLLIACFLTLMFHKVVWQNMQEVVGLLVTTLQQIYHRIFQ